MASEVHGTLSRVCSHVTDHGLSEGLPPGLQTELETVLSPESLSEAFTDNTTTGTGTQHPGINYDTVLEAFKPLEQQDGLQPLIWAIVKDNYMDIGATLSRDPTNIPLLRAVLVLLLSPISRRPEKHWCREIIVHLANALISIEKVQSLRDIFRRWLIGDVRVLGSAVKGFHDVLSSQNQIFRSENIHPLLYVLDMLYSINENAGCLVPRRLFYLNTFLQKSSIADRENDIIIFYKNSNPQTFGGNKPLTFIDFPFLLDVKAKWTYLKEDIAMMQNDRQLFYNTLVRMNQLGVTAAVNHNGNNPRGAMGPGLASNTQPLLPAVPTHLVFNNVSRRSIIGSAMDNVDRYMKEGPNVWLKPLQVNFGQGEFAEDFGGPSKEFFYLLFKALMEPQLGIFRRVNESVSSTVWFNPGNKDLVTLEKIGLLFALLIFNKRIITLTFPLLLYEVLLAPRCLEVRDLTSFDRTSVDELEQLRDLSDDALDSRSLDFKNLQADGENVCVERDNLEMYIKENKMYKLAQPQCNVFIKGFNILANRYQLLRKIVTPEDLRNIIKGGELNWKRLEKSTRYKPPYCKEHSVIKSFWAVFHAMEQFLKIKYLILLTGADHVPIEGFQSLDFVIKRLDTRQEKYGYADPSQICPAVMTCPGYYSMDLPEYETDDDVRIRLYKFIDMGVGFYRESRPSTT